MIEHVAILGNHIQALGISRLAAKIGLKVSLFSNYPLSITRFSNSCKSFNKYSTQEDLLELIYSNLATNNSILIIPTNDRMIDFLRLNYHKLAADFLLALPEPNILDLCHDKRKTYQTAREINIPIPFTITLDHADSLEQIKDQVDFPVIIKPAFMFKFYEKVGKKAYLCSTKEELKANVEYMQQCQF